MAIFQDNRILRSRLKWLRVAVVLVCLVFLAKLWHLSILRSDEFSQMAERNRIRAVSIVAPRGLIYDREGRVLVDNIQSVNLAVFRDEVEDLDRTLEFLAEVMEVGRESVLRRLEQSRGFSPIHPIVVKESLSLDEVALFLARQTEYPELGLVKQPRRIYRYGDLAAHLLGYVGEVSRQELVREEFANSRAGDIVGKYGVERAFNDVLTGRDGRRRLLVNSLGKGVQDIGLTEAVEGSPLTLTLDLDLQLVAEKELGEDPGAVVALDPRTGEILVMASRPAFDPNQFAARISADDWARLLSDRDHPMQNRSIQNTFSPGSVYKLVSALAGLEIGLIDERSAAFCGGGITLYGHYFRCWKQGGHGLIRLREAIQQSCNVYFYQLGQKLRIDQLATLSHRLGLGVRTGIDLTGEAVGLIPTEEWKRRTTGQPWYPGETISVVIGQGPVNVTPLQLARATGVISTGRAPEPHLTLTPASGDHVAAFDKEVGIDPKHMDLLREAMWGVVNHWGTGRAAQVSGFEVCGKTGTAQVIGNQARSRLSEEEAARFEPNAWFVGFAPRDDPEIVVSVLVQRGGGGGSAAAPIAGKILERYYEKKQIRRPPPLEVADAGASGSTAVQDSGAPPGR